jgi:hypothetical protein
MICAIELPDGAVRSPPTPLGTLPANRPAVARCPAPFVRDQSPTRALQDFTEEIGVERREKRYLVIELTSGWYGWRFSKPWVTGSTLKCAASEGMGRQIQGRGG